MVILDATIVNIALPQAQAALGISDADRQWMVTAYALPFGALLLLGGRIADYVGRKQILIISLSGFAIASAVGGAAQVGWQLFIARAFQGAFAAMLAPAALSLVTVTFHAAKERAKAFAVFGAITGGGAAIGLLLGGVLTEYASWRWCLFVNIPIAIIAVLAAIPVLQGIEGRGRHPLRHPGCGAGHRRARRAGLGLHPAGRTRLGLDQHPGLVGRRGRAAGRRSCWSSSGRAARCCRCGSWRTGTGQAPTWSGCWSAPACSRSSCS